jgi:KaiC/GvpD/RAD55 family RecA-like ATPase
MESGTSSGSGRLDAVLAKLVRVKCCGSYFMARCPVHDDREASLSVKLTDSGNIGVKCFAGCAFEAIVSATGLPSSMFFADNDNGRSNGHSSHGGNGSSNGQREEKTSLTLAEFAAHKKLPVETLRNYGVHDAIRYGRSCVEFEYLHRDGSRARTRQRTSLGGKRFSWKDDGQEIVAYEPDLGRLAKAQRYVVIVEGESDTLTLLHMGFPALGVPGADATRVLKADHFVDLHHVFFVREPGAGGDTFAMKVPKALAELGFSGRVHEVRMPDGAKDPSGLFQRDQAGFHDAFEALLEAAKNPPARSKHLIELIETQVSDGVFFPTGFSKLDRELDDGGLPTKSLTVILGGPGSRKTGLGTHFADHLSRLGAAVMFMACDESRQSIVTRLGQRAGFTRAGLRDKTEIGAATRAGQKSHEASLKRVLRLVEIDDEADAQTIEEAHEELLRAAEDRTRVLIIDSLQTARCKAAEELAQTAETLRIRTDAKVSVLKRIKKTGTIVIVISEVSRAFYNGSQKRIEKEHVLSAGKESGGIEFGIDLLIGLVRGKTDEDAIELVVAKCRLGREPRFWLKWNRDRARLDEIDEPDQTPAERDAADEARRAQTRKRVVAALLKHPGMSKTKLRDELHIGRDLVIDAVDELVEMSVLEEGPRNHFTVCPGMGGKCDGAE